MQGIHPYGERTKYKLNDGQQTPINMRHTSVYSRGLDTYHRFYLSSYHGLLSSCMVDVPTIRLESL
jgi:hypothetical protein